MDTILIMAIFPLLAKKYEYQEVILNYKIYNKILQIIHRFVQNFALQRQNKHAEKFEKFKCIVWI